MRHLLAPFGIWTVLFLLTGGGLQAQQFSAVDKLADEIEPRVIAWRRDIHQHPELGFREVRTAALVAEHLKKLGLEVRTAVGRTGVVGTLRGGRPGPVIALRAEMDALPITEDSGVPFASKVAVEYRGKQTGVMHACGHDAHTAVLMGAAEVLSKVRGELSGSVMFIFQPAEEGSSLPDVRGGGAGAMLQDGLFRTERPVAIFALHAGAGRVGTAAFRPRELLGSADNFRITVKGRQTHAAIPWRGVDPIVTASQIVLALQTIPSRMVDLNRSPAILSVGAINGGNRENIIPDQVEIIGTIRTADAEVRQKVQDTLKQVAQGIATSAGAEAEVRIFQGAPAVFNDPTLAESAQKTLERVFGKNNISQPRAPLLGGEDFSLFTKDIPGFYFILGVTPKDADPRTAAPVHSPRFFLDESSLKHGVRALVALAVDRLGSSR